MLKCRSHKKQSSKGLSQLQLCLSGIDHCLVSICRDHPRCRWGHSTNSPQRKTTSSNFPPATSSTCWITPMRRGGKAGWEDRLGCFPQTTQSSCKETPQAMILKRLRAFCGCVSSWWVSEREPAGFCMCCVSASYQRTEAVQLYLQRSRDTCRNFLQLPHVHLAHRKCCKWCLRMLFVSWRVSKHVVWMLAGQAADEWTVCSLLTHFYQKMLLTF